MFFAPEAKLRDTEYTEGIISISSEKWGLFPINKAHFYPEKCSKSIKCRNYTMGVFVPEAEQSDTEHLGYNLERLQPTIHNLLWKSLKCTSATLLRAPF